MNYVNNLDKSLSATKFAFILFIFFVLSFFLRLPSRIPILGVIRVDLLVVLTIFLMILFAKVKTQESSKLAKYLLIIFCYVILTLPLVTWPGSVLNKGIPDFIKAIIFFFFTYKLVLDEGRLKVLVYAFLFANTFRIIEPLYLNLTQGYWGSQTSFGWDQVNRLAGGPHDVINGNGLAFVIASVLPFYHYLFAGKGFKRTSIYLILVPVLMYTMSLTLSRSGILAVAIIYTVVFFKSDRKPLLCALGLVGIVAFMASLNEHQRDRYLSIFSSDTVSSSSAQGRFSGLERDFGVAMQAPIFGHGIGNSQEANWNLGGHAQPSHNLWIETFGEIGAIGLILFVLYAKEIFASFRRTNVLLHKNREYSSDFLKSCVPAMQVWLAMNFLFSFASYGLSSYEWYLFGGFSAVMYRISQQNIVEAAKPPQR